MSGPYSGPIRQLRPVHSVGQKQSKRQLALINAPNPVAPKMDNKKANAVVDYRQLVSEGRAKADGAAAC